MPFKRADGRVVLSTAQATVTATPTPYPAFVQVPVQGPAGPKGDPGPVGPPRVPSDATPLANTGIGGAGISEEYARGDHFHPGSGAGGVIALTAPFTMPAVSAAGVASTDAADGLLSVGQYVWVATLGFFQVDGLPGGNTVTLRNLGYPENADPGVVAAAGKLLSASGAQPTLPRFTAQSLGVATTVTPEDDTTWVTVTSTFMYPSIPVTALNHPLLFLAYGHVGGSGQKIDYRIRDLAGSTLVSGTITENTEDIRDIFVPGPSTTLSSLVDDATTTFPVVDGSVFPSTPFYAVVASEVVSVTTVVGNNLTVVRAQLGTLNVSHSSGAHVDVYVPVGSTDSGLMLLWQTTSLTEDQGVLSLQVKLNAAGNPSSLYLDSVGALSFRS